MAKLLGPRVDFVAERRLNLARPFKGVKGFLVCGRRLATIAVNSAVANATRLVLADMIPALKRRAKIMSTLRVVRMFGENRSKNRRAITNRAPARTERLCKIGEPFLESLSKDEECNSG